MKRARFVLFTGLLLSATIALAQGTSFDLTGSWDLQASGSFGKGIQDCVFEGSMTLTQTGTSLAGSGMLSLISGPPACPANPTATLTGALIGNTFEMATGSGQDGDATFTGLVGDAGRSIQGDFSVTVGPFFGLAGSWGAAPPPVGPPAIPTLGLAGLLLLALALATASIWLLARRRALAD